VRLERLFKKEVGGLRYREHVTGGGPRFRDHACELGRHLGALLLGYYTLDGEL
jgi:hypothetical protein